MKLVDKDHARLKMLWDPSFGCQYLEIISRNFDVNQIFFSLYKEFVASVISICSYLVFQLVIMMQNRNHHELLSCLWSAGTESHVFGQQTGIQP